jgi:hypothetical protein
VIRWTPRLVWEENDVQMALPVGVWDYTFPTVGGEIQSDAGFPASYTVRKDRCLSVPFRFYEEEWPTIRALVEYAQQSDAPFLWYPDGDEDDYFEVYLEAPALGDDVKPLPDGDYPAVLFLPLVLVKVDGSAWDEVEYFSEPA